MSDRMFFNNESFNNLYLSSSKYAKKKALLDDFYSAWYDVRREGLRTTTIRAAANLSKNTTFKNNIKDILIGKGHTAAAVTGLWKAFDRQVKIN